MQKDAKRSKRGYSLDAKAEALNELGLHDGNINKTSTEHGQWQNISGRARRDPQARRAKL
ncbi:MAG: hypothetical protein OXG78_09940 [Chloroflexi bacterium]|nr:hypothetical protein [Chloroflexota bacterium]